jgi:hypothetical protein
MKKSHFKQCPNGKVCGEMDIAKKSDFLNGDLVGNSDIAKKWPKNNHFFAMSEFPTTHHLKKNLFFSLSLFKWEFCGEKEIAKKNDLF